jgi:large subunit ribosomal protein L23
MVDMYKVIKRALVTEKAQALKAEANKVSFEVHPKATKTDVKNAVEKQFDVTVTQVATMNFRGKTKRVGQTVGRRANWKKAVVTLKEGDEIDVLGQGDAGGEATEG